MSQGSTDTDKVTYKDTDTVTLTDQVTDTAGSQDWSGIHFTFIYFILFQLQSTT